MDIYKATLSSRNCSGSSLFKVIVLLLLCLNFVVMLMFFFWPKSTAPDEKTTATPTEEVVAVPTEEVIAAPTEEVVAAPTEEVVAVPTEEVIAAPAEEVVATPTEEVAADLESNNNTSDEKKLDPQDGQIAFNDALNAFYKEDYGRAEVALQKAIKVFPNDINAFNLLGAIKTKQKEWKDARAAFYRALNIDPSYFPSRYNIGEIDFLQGNFQASYDYFKKLQSDYDNNELIGFKLVLLNLKLDKKEAAEEEFKKLPYPGSTAAWYYAQAALAVFNGDKSKAHKYISSAQTFYPENEEDNIFLDSLKEAELAP
ncbi:MAG: hypothetical protein ACK5LK_05015 [Chthoniobacterales bacterium]